MACKVMNVCHWKVVQSHLYIYKAQQIVPPHPHSPLSPRPFMAQQVVLHTLIHLSHWTTHSTVYMVISSPHSPHRTINSIAHVSLLLPHTPRPSIYRIAGNFCEVLFSLYFFTNRPIREDYTTNLFGLKYIRIAIH